MASKAPPGVVLTDDDPRHGTLSAYNYYRCRCERCADANTTRKQKDRMARWDKVKEQGPTDIHQRRMVRRDLEWRVAQGRATQSEREHLWNLQAAEARRAREAELERLIAQQRTELWLDKRCGLARFQRGASQPAERKGGVVVLSLHVEGGPDRDLPLHSLLPWGGANRHLVEWSDPTGETAIEWAEAS